MSDLLGIPGDVLPFDLSRLHLASVPGTPHTTLPPTRDFTLLAGSTDGMECTPKHNHLAFRHASCFLGSEDMHTFNPALRKAFALTLQKHLLESSPTRTHARCSSEAVKIISHQCLCCGPVSAEVQETL